MKKHLLAAAVLAAIATGSAHAYTVDATVAWTGYTGAHVATGANGTLTTGTLLNDPTLQVDANKTSYGLSFNIGAAPTIAGYTFDHIEWFATGNTFAGGSATSNNPSGSLIEDLSSITRLRVGTTWAGSQLGSTFSEATGSFLGNPTSLGFNDTLSLGDDQDSLSTGWLSNNALTIYALASAADSFTSDGNSDASFSNYVNVGVQARYVYTQDPPVTVPEPASMALVGLGMMGLAAIRRRK